MSDTLSIQIELPDKQSVPVKVQKGAYPKDALKVLGEQMKINQVYFFGLQRPIDNPTGTEKDEDLWVFVNDDSPLGDYPKYKCFIKSFPYDPRSEINCPKTCSYLYDEVVNRLRVSTNYPNADVVYQLAAFFQQSESGDFSSSKKITNTSEVSKIFPESVISKYIKGETAIKSICTAHALLFGLKEHELRIKMLSYVTESLPSILSTQFEVRVASTQDFNYAIKMYISPFGLGFYFGDMPLANIPIDQIFDWNLTEIVGGAAQQTTMSRTRRFSMRIEPMASIDEGESKKKKFKKTSALSRALGNMSTRDLSKEDSTSNVTSRKKYALSITVDAEYVQDVELYYYSKYSDDFRLSDMLQFYTDRAVDRSILRNSEKTSHWMDDPSQGLVTCKAKFNFYTENEGELVFLKDEDIKVEKKLGKGFYYGTCNDVSGIFRGNMVSFRKSSFVDSAKPMMAGSMKQDSMLQAQWTLSDPSQGVIVCVRLLDETKMMLAISYSTTALELTQQVADKIELKDVALFQISDVVDNQDRWLHPKIPVIAQGVTPSSKLVMKVRAYTKPVAEMSDPVAIHLLFEQSRQRVLKEDHQLSETDILELCGFHLQALLSDHDKNIHKPGYFENVDNFIPQSLISLHGSSGWQKRIFANHQRYVGLSKAQAERAYLKRLFGNGAFSRTLFPCLAPENEYISVSPLGLTIFTKTANGLKEITYEFGETLLDWGNSSLSLEIEVRQSGNTFTLHLLPYNISSVIELLWIYSSERLRRPLQDKCQQVRRAFELLEVPLVNPYDSIGTKYDPELLASCLRNGSSLCQLINSIKPADKGTIIIEDSESDDLAEYKCLENISLFLDVCGKKSSYWGGKGLGLLEDDLFQPEQLYHFTLENFQKVLECLTRLFTLLNVEAVLNMAGMNRISVNARSSVIGDPLRKQILDSFSLVSAKYLHDLDIVVNKFLEIIRENSVLPVKQTTAIFRNIEMIYNFQHQFHTKLPSDGAQLGSYLFSKFDCNDLYSVYFTGQHDAFVELAKLGKDPNFLKVLETLETGSNRTALQKFHDLQSLLTKPTNFILKLDEIVKSSLANTAEKHPDYKNFFELRKRLSSFFGKVKNVKKMTDNTKTISILQERIENLGNVNLFDFGELLLSGNIHLFSKDTARIHFGKETVLSRENSHHVFLFETHLVICKFSLDGHKVKYELSDSIPLNFVVTKSTITGEGLSDFKSNHYYSFEVSRVDKLQSFVFVAPSFEQKTKWVSAIDAISKNLNSQDLVEMITKEVEIGEKVKAMRARKG